jgi:hypothetical protein
VWNITSLEWRRLCGRRFIFHASLSSAYYQEGEQFCEMNVLVEAYARTARGDALLN